MLMGLEKFLFRKDVGVVLLGHTYVLQSQFARDASAKLVTMV
jgi:hypothetical protein